MRDLKFRVWWEDGDEPEIYTEYDLFDDTWTSSIYKTIEQYTGCTDKNGKEIYEGDIMSDKTLVEFFNDPDVIGSCGCCVGRFFGSGFVITTNARPCELEVIGNIHENPDLLKEVRQK